MPEGLKLVISMHSTCPYSKRSEGLLTKQHLRENANGTRVTFETASSEAYFLSGLHTKPTLYHILTSWESGYKYLL